MQTHQTTSFFTRIASGFLCLLVMGTGPGLAAQTSEPEPEPEPEQTGLEQVGNEGTGIFHLNQSAADATNQDNVLVVSAVEQAGAAIADAGNSQRTFSPTLAVPSSAAVMTEVANGASGLVGINQSTASGSSQGNLVALAVSDDAASVAYASAVSSTSSIAYRMSANNAPDVGIASFGNGAVGIIQANQLAGIGGQQSNIVALASASDGIALANAASLQARPDDTSTDEGAPPPLVSTASLRDSLNGAVGLAQINQATGADNRQTNLIAKAFGSYADATTISDTGLGDVRSPVLNAEDVENAALEGQTEMQNSFEGFIGVGQVSQVVGYGNQTANTISVSIGAGPGS